MRGSIVEQNAKRKHNRDRTTLRSSCAVLYASTSWAALPRARWRGIAGESATQGGGNAT